MQKPPIQNTIDDIGGVSRPWVNWFMNVWTIVDAVESSGTTAQRPITGLFVGRPYFDTTLGKPIWLKSVNPNVWVLATGAAA